MKSLILIVLIVASLTSFTKAQDCILGMNTGLYIKSKVPVGGSQCSFLVTLCVKKATSLSKMIVYTISLSTDTIHRTINVEGFSVGSLICQDFSFVTHCNSIAHFLAISFESNGQSCGKVTNNLILPITLVDFAVNYTTPSKITLNWQTATEINASHFIIQQSSNGQEFLEIGEVKAIGESLTLQNYSFQVPSFATASSKRYFRLMMIDNDGGTAFSPIISSSRVDSKKLSVYPNPVGSYLFINHPDVDPAEVEIYTSTGQKILVYFNEGKEYLDVSSLEPGLYFLKFKDDLVSLIKE
ncbi:MAG: T9SS type A sorting domain-containing protein [Bacteroidota bacterium]|nr:T9SS type A sorting domain-containing protein [Bacteroidota bacterium]